MSAVQAMGFGHDRSTAGGAWAGIRGICGVAGIATARGSVPLAGIEAMAGAIAHRGPDGQGLRHDPALGVALAHRRLSIIDLSADS